MAKWFKNNPNIFFSNCLMGGESSAKNPRDEDETSYYKNFKRHLKIIKGKEGIWSQIIWMPFFHLLKIGKWINQK